MAKASGGEESASKYQGYTKGRLHQALSQTYNCNEAKEIAQEALRRLKIKQILKHQPHVQYIKLEKSTSMPNDDALPLPQMNSPSTSIEIRVMNSLMTGIHLYNA